MINRQPDISIITVNYNGFPDTCEMLRSIKQHVKSCRYEIIVVDNGSYQDESVRLNEDFPNLRTIRSNRNLGFAGGNNLGIRQAKGKYILLLNNDTLIKDDSLHYLCETLDTHPKIGAVSPKIRFAHSPSYIQFAGFTPMGRYTLRNRSIGFNEPDQGQFDTPHNTAFLHGAAMLVRQEAIAKSGLMPEIYFLYYEEMDWCNRFLQQGFTLYYDPRCTIFHKESCTTGQNSPLKNFYLSRNRLLYAWRNRYGFSRYIALLYQLGIVIPKNCFIPLLKGNISLSQAVFQGSIAFIRLKNKNASYEY